MENEFDDAILRELVNVLESVRTPNFPVGSHIVIDRFCAMVTRYLEEKVLSYPELVDELPGFAKNLSKVEPKALSVVLDYLLANCRACMFHNDACFMNLIFLTFKSVEQGRPIAPNAVRPTMRVIHSL